MKPASSRRSLLVSRARAGDHDAYSELVAPLLSVAVGAAVLITGSRADAADAVQDALLSAWQGLDRLRDAEAFPSWFRTQVIRAAQRQAGSRRHFVALDEVSELRAHGDLDQTLEERQVQRALRAISDADRMILVLHHYWRLPISESAAALNIPPGTVKSRVHHAMARLRAAYDAEDRR